MTLFIKSVFLEIFNIVTYNHNTIAKTKWYYVTLLFLSDL